MSYKSILSRKYKNIANIFSKIIFMFKDKRTCKKYKQTKRKEKEKKTRKK